MSRRLQGATVKLVWILLATALLFSLATRWRLRDIPLERDEGEYAYVGQQILHGIPPFQHAYSMKLPGTSLLYAGMMSLFGQTAAGIHLGLLLANLGAILLVFGFTRDIVNPVAGAFAALTYALLSTSPAVYGMAAHATHFVTLFSVAGVWVLWRARGNGSPIDYLGSGLLLGLAFLMKQQAFLLVAFGLAAILFAGFRTHPTARKIVWGAAALFAAGSLLPYALTCLWLWRAGVFGKFWFWTAQYASEYAGEVHLGEGLGIFLLEAPMAVGTQWPLWLLGALGAILMGRSRGTPGSRTFVYGLLVSSFLCVCPGFYFRPHYFIVLLPAVALLAGFASARLLGMEETQSPASFSENELDSASLRGQKRGKKTRGKRAAVSPSGSSRWKWAFGLILSATFLSCVWADRAFYFSLTPAQASKEIYWTNPFVEGSAIGEYIKTHSTPSQRVAVLGSEPEILFCSQRSSATGYLYTYALMETQPYALTMQKEMIKEIEEAQPEFLVFVSISTSWLKENGSSPLIFDWGNAYINDHYHPVGLADMVPDRTEYTWDEKATTAKPQSQDHIWLFRRNAT